MIRISVTVQSQQGDHRFEAVIHRPTTLDEFHLDPVQFYEEWGRGVPALPHHEIEITLPGQDFFANSALHMHRSRQSGLPFVCFPHRIATIGDATRIFGTWCLGTVATIVEGVDLNTLYSECKSDSERLKGLVGERYGICFKHVEVVS